MTLRDTLQTVAIEWCVLNVLAPKLQVNVWTIWTSCAGIGSESKNINLVSWRDVKQIPLVEDISWASVLKLIEGSRKLNNAQDLLLKFKPWKHASDMLLPCNSIVPPKTVPYDGNGTCIVLNCKPATWAKTFCQCLWCLASVIVAFPCNKFCGCWLIQPIIFF